jgi:hypothetical protein
MSFCIFLQVFAMAQFYNILQLAMAIYYPQAVQFAAETKVSLKRLEVSLHNSILQHPLAHHLLLNVTDALVSYNPFKSFPLQSLAYMAIIIC